MRAWSGRGGRQIGGTGLVPQEQTPIEADGGRSRAPEAIGLAEVGQRGRRLDSGDPIIEAEPEGPFAILHREVDSVRGQAVTAIRRKDSPTIAVQNSQAGVRRRQRKGLIRQDDAAIELRERERLDRPSVNRSSARPS